MHGPFVVSTSTSGRRGVLAAVLAGLLVLLLAPPLARAQAGVEVRIGSTLDPATVGVAPGTTVTWVNTDDERHRMRSTDGPEEFDSGNLEPGERFSHTFRAAGTTRYLDDRNDENTAYHGSVTVTSTSSEPDPTSPTDPGEDGTTQPTEPATHAVSMAGRRFAPATLQITTGDTVRFVNDDDRDHTATADDRSFDTGILAEGQEFERTFTRAGTFSYLCLLHPDMTGTIAVADAGGTAPPPAPRPDPPSTPQPPPAPSEPTAGDAGASGPQRRTVEMRDFSFGPASVEVPAGSTIVFSNTGRALHTATADDGSFDSDLVSPGGSFERRFDQPGTFAYTCLLHPEMVGEVVVTTAAGGIVPAESPAAPAASPPSSAGSDAGAPPGTVLVALEDFAFSPGEVDVSVGDTVRFRNDGQALHTATARDGSHDSGLLRPGGVDERTFEEPGTFAYWCTLHPEMVATIRVAAADGSVPAAVEPPPGGDGAGDDGGEADAGGPAAVSMVDNEFLPATVEVVAGEEVVWSNDGQAVHTVTAEDGGFDSGLVAAGEQYRLRFEEPGTVAYLCSVHPGMTGEVRVLALGDDGEALGAASAVSGGGGGPSTVALQLLMLGAFAVALAGFTALSRRVGALDGDARA